jgi:hypothetical protein
LSEALALTAVVPRSAAPDEGDVTATVGGVVSLNTVTVTGSEVQLRPSRSRATAVSVCDPLLAVLVFHCTEYGGAVSSTPTLTPSTLNWTPMTVRPPTIVTFALTAIVLPTVDPDVGEVIVTINLLRSCAEAGDAESEAKPRVTNSGAAAREITRNAGVLLIVFYLFLAGSTA